MRSTGRLVRGLLVAGALALVGYALIDGGLTGWASGDVLNPLLIGALILAEFAVTRAGATKKTAATHPSAPRRGRRPLLPGRPRRGKCRPAGRRDAARNRGTVVTRS